MLAHSGDHTIEVISPSFCEAVIVGATARVLVGHDVVRSQRATMLLAGQGDQQREVLSESRCLAFASVYVHIA